MDSQIISRELKEGETILWSGQPNPRRLFTKYDIFFLPFSLLWCGFAVFWLVSALNWGIFAIFGVPFVLFGLYIVFGRFIVKTNKKRNTYYAITDKRVLIIVTASGRSKHIVSAELCDIRSESFSLSRSGTGNMVFSSLPLFYNMYLNTGMDFFTGSYQNNIAAFFDIDNAEKVYDIYKDAKSRSRKS